MFCDGNMLFYEFNDCASQPKKEFFSLKVSATFTSCLFSTSNLFTSLELHSECVQYTFPECLTLIIELTCVQQIKVIVPEKIQPKRETSFKNRCSISIFRFVYFVLCILHRFQTCNYIYIH